MQLELCLFMGSLCLTMWTWEPASGDPDRYLFEWRQAGVTQRQRAETDEPLRVLVTPGEPVVARVQARKDRTMGPWSEESLTYVLVNCDPNGDGVVGIGDVAGLSDNMSRAWFCFGHWFKRVSS